MEGETLSECVRRTGPLTAREAVRLMLERASSRALLMDFGVARPSSTAPDVRADGLTRVGEVVGPPEYKSAESHVAFASLDRSKG